LSSFHLVAIGDVVKRGVYEGGFGMWEFRLVADGFWLGEDDVVVVVTVAVDGGWWMVDGGWWMVDGGIRCEN
jgi:hypothetical protein